MPFLSTYDLISVTYRFEVVRVQWRSIMSRNYSRFDVGAFSSDLTEVDWSGFFSSGSVDQMLDFLNAAVTTGLDRHAPLRRVSLRHVAAPWLSPAIRDLMRARDRARRAWRKYGGEGLGTLFSLNLETVFSSRCVGQREPIMCPLLARFLTRVPFGHT